MTPAHEVAGATRPRGYADGPLEASARRAGATAWRMSLSHGGGIATEIMTAESRPTETPK